MNAFSENRDVPLGG